jgi:hypothetical protein
MTPKKVIHKFNSRIPAMYKITVLGEVDGNLSVRLGGLKIKVDRSKDKEPVTVLVGLINDQAALSGILNTLYDFQFPIISVTMLNNI